MPDDLPARLCQLAASAPTVAQWRQAAVGLLAEHVRFDAALFHELSPRAPLDRAGLVGFDLDVLAGTRTQWDDHAVDLAPLALRAMAQGGVATDLEAFGARGPARTRWNRLLARPLRIRSLVALHLVIDTNIISAVLLARRRDPAFSTRERESLQPLVPVLSVCDALHLSRDARALPGLRTEVRCLDERLTPRQREIVEYVALGRTNLEIAEALAISEHTVRNLLVRIRARVGAANRAELVRVSVLHPA